MRVTLLGSKSSTYANSSILDEFKHRGHSTSFIRPQDCMIQAGKDAGVWYKGEKIPAPDVALLRTTALRSKSNVVSYEYMVANHFQLEGCLLINSMESKRMSSNKFRTLQVLAHHGITVPETYIVKDMDHLEELIEDRLGLPVILKTQTGSMGRGVMVVDSLRSARSVFDTVSGMGKVMVVQTYLAEGERNGLRANVVGDRVATAIRRINPHTDRDFRTHPRYGITQERVELSTEYENIAVKAARICGLQLAGVDMIDTKEGLYVIEVNSTPAFELEKVTGDPFTETFVEHIEQMAKVREM